MNKEQIQSRLDELHKEISKLKAEESSLNSQLNNIVSSEINSALKTELNGCSMNNMSSFFVTTSSKTLDRMSEFYFSHEKYLLLSNFFFKFDSKYKKFSFIITKCTDMPTVLYTEIVMSDLKGIAGYVLELEPQPKAIYDYKISLLKKELSILFSKHNLDEKLILFDSPLKIGCQTWGNKREHGDGLFYPPGSEFGETTDFYIIGVKIGS